jgi:hypothetical protein
MHNYIRNTIIIFCILIFSRNAYSFENLQEMEARKIRQTTATWGFSYLEDPVVNYIWQPESLTYTDTTTGKEVWVLVRQPDHQDIYSKEHGSNIWSHDGSRIGFFDSATRKTANPQINNDRGAMRWIVNTNGSGLKAAEGYGKYSTPLDGFGWAHTELAYYAFGSHAIIDKPQDTLCKMHVADNNVVSGSVLLSTMNINTYYKEMVKDGLGTDDKRIVYRDFTPHISGNASCGNVTSNGIYYTDLDGSLSVDGHWTVARSIGDYAPEHVYEERFHDVWAPGPSQSWIMGDYSGTSDIFAIFKLQGNCPTDGGPIYETWDGDSFGVFEDIKIVSDGGAAINNPYKNPYFGHPAFDRWGRYSIIGTYTDNPKPGTRIWDIKNNLFLPNYPLATTYDGQHHSWNGWSDLVIGVDPTSLFIRANSWTGQSSEAFNVASTHHPGLMDTNYMGYPRPSQSPDGTKVAFAAFWLNNGSDRYPYINWAVVHYPHPPEITKVSAHGNSVSIQFDWGLDRTTRGYTTRGWPDENTSLPPAPRETKKFRLWRSTDQINWSPQATIEAKPFEKFDFANGGLKSGQSSYWLISNQVADGTYYYAVTSIEQSGLESRTLSNGFQIDIANGSGTGFQVSTYPDKPGGITPFYSNTPSAPILESVNTTGIAGHYRLKWNEPNQEMVRYYNIYYSTTGKPPVDPRYRIASVPVGTSQWLDWNAHQSQPAYYLITSVDTQGNEGVSPSPEIIKISLP